MTSMSMPTSKNWTPQHSIILHGHGPNVTVLPRDPLATTPWIPNAPIIRVLEGVVPPSAFDSSEMEEY